MDIYNLEFDKRSECYLVLATMTLKEYKEFVEDAFNNKGNIAGQRDVISRSAVASKIRTRMSDDFKKGAVFPQVVIGLLVKDFIFKKFEKFDRKGDNQEIIDFILSLDKNCVSIIDGIQRTNIYFDNYIGNEERPIRVEFYVTTVITKLLYRMLVLNTGQVPWNTRRQIEVVFDNLADAISKSIYDCKPEWKDIVELMGVDENRRRTQAGKFQKSAMIQMYLGFNTRNVKVDVSEELASEFQRFDMIESIDKDVNFELFIDCIIYLLTLDFEFSKCAERVEGGQFKEGNDIFTSIPACLGFIVACAEYILGKAPVERQVDKKKELNEKLSERIRLIIEFLNEKQNPLALDTLNSVVNSLSKTKIGDEMRRLFKNAFSEIIKYDDLKELDSLEAFWREQ